MSQTLKISDFCKTGSGGTPYRKTPAFYEGGTIPWVKSGELRENVILDTEEKITEEAIKKSSAKIVPKGSLLLAMYGATVGRLAFLGIDATTNQAVCNIQPDEKVCFPKYLYYALLKKVPEFLNMAAGGAQPNISQALIKDTKIFLPPLEEQKRIASILDKADAIRRKRQQAIDLTDQLLRSVFLDMFGDPVTNPKGWSTKSLGDAIKLKSGNFLPAKSMAEDGKYHVYGGNGVNGMHSEYMFEEPKIVIGRVGAYCGAVHKTHANSWVTDNALYVSECDKVFNEDYLEWVLRFHNLNQYASQAGQPLISAGRLKDIKISVPHVDHQEKFSSFLKARARISKNIESSEKWMTNLFSSLTQRAFRGELGKQTKAA